MLLNRLAIKAFCYYRRLVSPFLGNRCRFHPTCSEYAIESMEFYNFGRACILVLCRLLRCHPFCKAGYDPVPVPVVRCRKLKSTRD